MIRHEEAPAAAPLLTVRDLSISFARNREHRVVDRVGFDIWPGQIVGLIGESGSGKTMTALSILRLLPRGARVASGSLMFAGRDLGGLTERDMRALRGREISMVFQNPMSTMNPALRVGKQVAEPAVVHDRLPWSAAYTYASGLLRRVHIPDAERRAVAYPHQFSGGMLQRAITAMAIACRPKLIIADEPTTALDVTIQAQILRLLREIRDTQGSAILLITHDLGVVAEICDWVVVMYAGRVLEQGPVDSIFAAPAHPYTRALLRAMPHLDFEGELEPIPGQIPTAAEMTRGCRFAARCSRRFAACDQEPPLHTVEHGHQSRCWLAVEGQER